MKKLLRETLIEKNVLFFSTGGVSAAVAAATDLKTAVACAIAVFAAVVLASTAASFASLITGRLGVLTVYITVSSGIMAAASSVASNFVTETADTLATALLLAAVSGTVLLCAPKRDETPAASVVRASLTAFMYAAVLTVLALVLRALSSCVPFASSPSMTLILIGFIVAAVNFTFVSIAERSENHGEKEEVTEDEQ